MSSPVLPPAQVPPHEHDDENAIRGMIAAALGERKLRLTDRRLLWLYVITVAAIGFFFWQQHNSNEIQRRHDQAQADQRDRDRRAFEAAERHNCDVLDSIITNSNRYFDRQTVAVRHRADLSPSVKRDAIRNYAQAHLPNLRCADLPGG